MPAGLIRALDPIPGVGSFPQSPATPTRVAVHGGMGPSGNRKGACSAQVICPNPAKAQAGDLRGVPSLLPLGTLAPPGCWFHHFVTKVFVTDRYRVSLQLSLQT